MPSGRSRNSFANILRFTYFTFSALSLCWMFAQYGGVNFVSTMILLPAFGYVALHLISLVNLFQKDKFLVGSSVDVLSLDAQKWIHRVGLVLPIPILLYMSTFGALVWTYNIADEGSYTRTVKFSAFENQIFGKSVIWTYLKQAQELNAPLAVEPIAAPVVETPSVEQKAQEDVDFGPYMADLQRRIKRNWFPPKEDTSDRVVTQFKISNEGVVSDAKVVKHGASTMSDDAAMAALRMLNARHLPEGAPSSVDIEFTFDYNVFSETASN